LQSLKQWSASRAHLAISTVATLTRQTKEDDQQSGGASVRPPMVRPRTSASVSAFAGSISSLLLAD
jgi:hypothetical protein